jgi:hypothetical protein
MAQKYSCISEKVYTLLPILYTNGTIIELYAKLSQNEAEIFISLKLKLYY